MKDDSKNSSDSLIPSPFYSPHPGDELLAELGLIFQKHGFQQFGFFCSKEAGNDSSSWIGASNMYSEGMLEYLKTIEAHMEEVLKGTIEPEEI